PLRGLQEPRVWGTGHRGGLSARYHLEGRYPSAISGRREARIRPRRPVCAFWRRMHSVLEVSSLVGVHRAQPADGLPALGRDLPSPFEGSPQGQLVRVLEVAADGQAARQAGDAELERLEQPGEVQRGGFALDVRVRAEDDLLDAFRLEPRQ